MRYARILALTGACVGTMAARGRRVVAGDGGRAAVRGGVVYHRFGEDAYPSTSVTLTV